jgi:hypothetical protein
MVVQCLYMEGRHIFEKKLKASAINENVSAELAEERQHQAWLAEEERK